MSFKEVLLTLQELFPQVDIRILKALAIEHNNDVDAAVEFILTEVLPALETPLKSMDRIPKSEEIKSEEMAASSDVVEQNKCGSADEADNDFALDQRTEWNNVLTGIENPSSLQNIVMLNDPPSSLSNQGAANQDSADNLQSILVSDEEKELMDQGTIKQENGHDLEPILVSTGIGFSSIDATNETEENLMHQDGFFSKSYASYDHIDNEFGEGSSVLPSESISVKPLIPEQEFTVNTDCVYTDSNTFLQLDLQTFEATSVDGDNSLPSTVATRSGQIVKTDMLEEFITDAKTYKKTLVSTLESVMDFAKVVEDKEMEAISAKEGALKAGLDVISRVESLKEMLTHAKEANHMHSGEIYGERSILATEIRELHSRLLSLADQNDKSLSVIEEMRHSLEARLAIADAEREAAEKVKLEKEANALRELIEQQNEMDKVVEKSNKLKQEAEENSKLREFLMDRGRVVDLIQGEIAVVCEDVRKMKERVDKGMPVGGLLYSGRLALTSFGFGASDRGSHSNQNMEHEEAAVINNVPDLISEPQEELAGVKCSIVAESINNSGGAVVASEDDWDMFEDVNEVRPIHHNA